MKSNKTAHCLYNCISSSWPYWVPGTVRCEVVWRSGCIDPRILDLSFMSRPLYPYWKGPPVPIEEEVVCAPEPAWTTCREAKSLPLPGLKPRPLSRSQSLYWLSYSGSVPDTVNVISRNITSYKLLKLYRCIQARNQREAGSTCWRYIPEDRTCDRGCENLRLNIINLFFVL
jgi:hypothetical protein